MVFQKGNPLRACVNKALATMKANGTLKRIQTTWLSKVVGVPVLKYAARRRVASSSAAGMAGERPPRRR